MTATSDPFDPRTAAHIQPVRRAAAGAIINKDNLGELDGEDSVIMRINDTIYRFPPEEVDFVLRLATGLFDAANLLRKHLQNK